MWEWAHDYGINWHCYVPHYIEATSQNNAAPLLDHLKPQVGGMGLECCSLGVLNNSWYVVPVSSIAEIHRFKNLGVKVAVVLSSPLLVTYLQNLCFESLQIQVLWHWGSWCPVREQWGSYRSKVLSIAWSFYAVHACRSQGKKILLIMIIVNSQSCCYFIGKEKNTVALQWVTGHFLVLGI